MRHSKHKNSPVYGCMHMLQYINNRHINLSNKLELDKEFEYAVTNYKVDEDKVTEKIIITEQDNGGFNTLTKFSGHVDLPEDMEIEIAIDCDDAGDFYFTDLEDNIIGIADFYNNHGWCRCKRHKAKMKLKKGKYKVFIRVQDSGGRVALYPYIIENRKWVDFKDSKFFKEYVTADA